MSPQAIQALKNKCIAFIGAGSMAEALIRGLLKAGATEPASIIATGRRQERLDNLHSNYGVEVSLDNAEAAAKADVVVLSVKPQIIERILLEITSSISDKSLVISIAAGTSISEIASALPKEARVWRAMPNLPAVVDAGAAAIAAGDHSTVEDERQVRAIFEAVGEVTQVDEALMDAVTGLSGSGPAYVFMIIEALSDAGVKVGLSRRQSQILAAQTVLGSAKLLIETGEHPGVLKDRVTSPGGTAIVGLHTLEEGGLRTTLINAVVAATQRCKELAKKNE